MGVGKSPTMLELGPLWLIHLVLGGIECYVLHFAFGRYKVVDEGMYIRNQNDFMA